MNVMLEARIIAVNTHGLAAQPSRPARGKDEAFVAGLFEDSRSSAASLSSQTQLINQVYAQFNHQARKIPDQAKKIIRLQKRDVFPKVLLKR